MPLFEETNQTKSTESVPNQSTNHSPTLPKEFNLVKTIGQLLPLAPFVFEQFTGQKVPQMTGTVAEIQTALLQISTNLQVVVNNQQQLAHRLIALETNANNHLTNLTHQFQSLRLTHTREKEKKQIEYNPPLENNEDY